MVTLLLVAVGVTAAAAVAWRLKPESAAYWAGAVGGIFGAAGLYLAWSSYRDDRAAEKQVLALPEIADQLAIAIRDQWTAEAELRRLNDPHPLPVSWEQAPFDLVDDWDALVRLATTGAGWPPVSDDPAIRRWADDPADLAGSDGELVNVLARVPTGRLVVLGGPGAGKTMLLVRLVLDLLARRAPGEQVPVLMSLASWDPSRQRPDDWLESRLITDYPGLAEAGPDSNGRSRARGLLSAGLVLPLLDGLDEIPDGARGVALARLDEMLRPGQRVVVTSRTDPYRVALHPAGGIEVRLTGAAGVELLPLRPDDVAAYLRGSAGGPVAAARWDPVLATFTTAPTPPVGQALTTPLMASLARVVYNPRPAESAAAVGRSPTELLDLVRFPTCTAIEQHLFDGYLPAAYRSSVPDHSCRWKTDDAERWLVFLARHLEHTIDGASNFAWWQLSDAARGPVGRCVARFIGGNQTPKRALEWSPQSVGQLVVDLVYGLTVGLTVGLATKLLGGLTGGLVVGMGSWFASGLAVAPADLAQAASPRSIVQQDRAAFRASFLVGLLSGVSICVFLFGFVDGFLTGVVDGFEEGLLRGLAFGLALGLVCGLWAAFLEAPWGIFVLTNKWLALHGRLPRDLMAFLDDAHRRGVLRQAGAVYQFRHIELQRRLANRPSPSQRG